MSEEQINELVEYNLEYFNEALTDEQIANSILDKAELTAKLKEKDKEIEKLKNGYCELKVKCNNGECDCTNEEYDGMIQCNMKLSLENDELRNILEKMGTNPNEILYLKDEVDRLNNIIDELEKYFAKPNKFIERPERMKILDKLKALKEGKVWD